jgi:protein-disulfide isomerase
MPSHRSPVRTFVAPCALALLVALAAAPASQAADAPSGGAVKASPSATAKAPAATSSAPAGAATKTPGSAAANAAGVPAKVPAAARPAGDGAAAPSKPADGSVLDRPTGTNVAIVVFEDLQCPDCRAAHPVLRQASKTEDVPLVIKDFPIARHEWAFPAAILAKWFEYESPELGVQFRDFVFANQEQITPENLRDAAEQFAQLFGKTLPENVDPDGKLQSRVQADYDLAVAMGLRYVPLIFVIGPGKGAERFREVTDVSKLGDTVREMKQKAVVRAPKAR